MKIIRSVQNSIKEGRFDEARAILDRQSSRLPTMDFVVFQPERDKNSDIGFAQLKNDFGNGRVSKGLFFLELISFSKRGKELGSILAFDRVPTYANISLLDSASSVDEKVQFIAMSLGTVELFTEMRIYSDDLYQRSEEISLDLFEQVSTGRFLRKNNDTILPFVRNSVIKLQAVKDRSVVR